MKEDELERKQRNSYTLLEADIKGIEMYRKGDMRHKHYKREKEEKGGGGGGGGGQNTGS